MTHQFITPQAIFHAGYGNSKIALVKVLFCVCGADYSYPNRPNQSWLDSPVYSPVSSSEC